MAESPEDERDVSWENRRTEALQEKAAFEALTANPGWRKLCAWMQQQVDTRTDGIVLKPCTGLKDQLEAEYAKGEVATFRLVMHMVATRIEEATEVARSLQDDHQNDSTDDAS